MALYLGQRTLTQRQNDLELLVNSLQNQLDRLPASAFKAAMQKEIDTTIKDRYKAILALIEQKNEAAASQQLESLLGYVANIYNQVVQATAKLPPPSRFPGWIKWAGLVAAAIGIKYVFFPGKSARHAARKSQAVAGLKRRKARRGK